MCSPFKTKKYFQNISVSQSCNLPSDLPLKEQAPTTLSSNSTFTGVLLRDLWLEGVFFFVPNQQENCYHNLFKTVQSFSRHVSFTHSKLFRAVQNMSSAPYIFQSVKNHAKILRKHIKTNVGFWQFLECFLHILCRSRQLTS